MLVLDAGHLIEYDHPYILLQRDGLFATMVKKTGPLMTDNLKKLAEQVLNLSFLKFLYKYIFLELQIKTIKT